MLKFVIEKKAKYTIVALLIIFVSLVVVNSFSSSSLTPAFYNPLHQVARSDSDFMSVDSDKDGIIDDSEKAFRIQLSNIDKVPAVCQLGYLFKGYDVLGNHACVAIDFKCKHSDGVNHCWLSSIGSGGIENYIDLDVFVVDSDGSILPQPISTEDPLMDAVLNSVFEIIATGNTYGVRSFESSFDMPETFELVELTEATLADMNIADITEIAYCWVDYDGSSEQDIFCLNEVAITSSKITLKVFYSTEGGSYTHGFVAAGEVNGNLFRAKHEIHSSAPTERDVGTATIVINI